MTKGFLPVNKEGLAFASQSAIRDNALPSLDKLPALLQKIPTDLSTGHQQGTKEERGRNSDVSVLNNRNEFDKSTQHSREIPLKTIKSLGNPFPVAGVRGIPLMS